MKFWKIGRKYKEERNKREKRKGGNKDWDWKTFFLSFIFLYFSFSFLLFLSTSFIFDRGHVTDLLRYVCFSFLSTHVMKLIVIKFLLNSSSGTLDTAEIYANVHFCAKKKLTQNYRITSGKLCLKVRVKASKIVSR